MSNKHKKAIKLAKAIREQSIVTRECPVTLNNDDRVIKAGFDLKTSFRGPAKVKR